MLMMRSPLLSVAVIFNVAEQSARPLMPMMRSPLLFPCCDFQCFRRFPIDARMSEPAKRSAADAHDALSIAFLGVGICKAVGR